MKGHISAAIQSIGTLVRTLTLTLTLTVTVTLTLTLTLTLGEP